MAVFNDLVEGGGGSSLMTKVTITLGILLLYLVGIMIYNLYFHPLSKFPGPKLWAATQLPYFISLVSGRLVKDQHQLHQAFGDVIRLRPNELSFAREEAWHDIYSHRPGHHIVPRDKTLYTAPNGMAQNIFTVIDSHEHSRMRKLLNSSLSEKSLRSQYPIIESYADLLMKRLHDLVTAPDTKGNGGVINMVDWTNFYTVDIIGDLAVGEPFGCLQNSEYHPWIKTLFTFLRGVVFAFVARSYPAVEWLLIRSLPKSVMDLQKQHIQIMNDRIARRLDLKTDRPDFITPFLKDNTGHEKMSEEEIKSNFIFILVAGSETTATTLCGIVNQLVQPRNKHALQELTSEIRSFFKSEEDITIERIRALPYLDAVINEGLRLCNPNPGGLPRIVPQGGDVFAGHYVPEKTFISIRPYVINRSHTYFTEPLTFAPERWLPGERCPARFSSDHLLASSPFSVGPANCLGKSLAWAEMRLFLARLLWAFDISEEEGRHLEWDSQKTWFLVHKEPVELRVKLR